MIKMYHKLNYVPKLGSYYAYVSYFVDGLLMLLVVSDLDTIPTLYREVKRWFKNTYPKVSMVEVVGVQFDSPDDYSCYFDINFI